MNKRTRRTLLRINAACLLLASVGGLVGDLRGAFTGAGPVARILGHTPHAAIGFVEAHGLALILAVLLWRAASVRSWHLTAVAVHVLLGSANVAFWATFAAADMVTMGYVSTAMHAIFATLQSWAAVSAATVSPEPVVPGRPG